MLYLLFDVVDIAYNLLEMTIEAIQCQLIKTQSDQFSTRPILP